MIHFRNKLALTNFIFVFVWILFVEPKIYLLKYYSVVVTILIPGLKVYIEENQAVEKHRLELYYWYNLRSYNIFVPIHLFNDLEELLCPYKLLMAIRICNTIIYFKMCLLFCKILEVKSIIIYSSSLCYPLGILAHVGFGNRLQHPKIVIQMQVNE